jgi:transcriptional regulator with XRE-family HTH domain
MALSIWDSQRLAVQQLVREMRKEAELTQAELAALLDKPQSYVSKYESGERRLDIIELKELCRTCGVSLADFCSRLDGAIKQGGLS